MTDRRQRSPIPSPTWPNRLNLRRYPHRDHPAQGRRQTWCHGPVGHGHISEGTDVVWRGLVDKSGDETEVRLQCGRSFRHLTSSPCSVNLTACPPICVFISSTSSHGRLDHVHYRSSSLPPPHGTGHVVNVYSTGDENVSRAGGFKKPATTNASRRCHLLGVASCWRTTSPLAEGIR